MVNENLVPLLLQSLMISFDYCKSGLFNSVPGVKHCIFCIQRSIRKIIILLNGDAVNYVVNFANLVFGFSHILK